MGCFELWRLCDSHIFSIFCIPTELSVAIFAEEKPEWYHNFLRANSVVFFGEPHELVVIEFELGGYVGFFDDSFVSKCDSEVWGLFLFHVRRVLLSGAALVAEE